jgi:hypothetical protein
MELRTDRVGVLLDQLATSREIAGQRLAGLTDEEYLWEPAPGAWSLRRREDATTPRAYGGGDWVLDLAVPEPDPPPVTTIAWRLGHLISGFSGRWEWTFGERRHAPETLVDFSPTAAGALAQLDEIGERWSASLAGMTDEQLDRPGYGQYPYGLDPELPFIGIIWWTNRELIHHLAEVALLRDLFRARRVAPFVG